MGRTGQTESLQEAPAQNVGHFPCGYSCRVLKNAASAEDRMPEIKYERGTSNRMQGLDLGTKQKRECLPRTTPQPTLPNRGNVDVGVVTLFVLNYITLLHLIFVHCCCVNYTTGSATL